jgi:hypothetical protein
MSKRKRTSSPPGDWGHDTPADGSTRLPDQSANPAVWKYVLLAVIFAAWLAFLIYCQLAGQAAQ